MSAVFGTPGGPKAIGPIGVKPTELITQMGTRQERQNLRQRRADAAAADPLAEAAREMRRRIAARGGAQSTLLGGSAPAAQGNVFKSNLGGTGRSTR